MSGAQNSGRGTVGPGQNCSQVRRAWPCTRLLAGPPAPQWVAAPSALGGAACGRTHPRVSCGAGLEKLPSRGGRAHGAGHVHSPPSPRSPPAPQSSHRIPGACRPRGHFRSSRSSPGRCFKGYVQAFHRSWWVRVSGCARVRACLSALWGHPASNVVSVSGWSRPTRELSTRACCLSVCPQTARVRCVFAPVCRGCCPCGCLSVCS